MDTIFRIMAVNLNASQSLDEEIIIGLNLSDLANSIESVGYTLHLRRGILEVKTKLPDDPEFTIEAESLAWKNVVLGKLDPQEAVSDGYIMVTGADPAELYTFIEYFN
jgi:alkyl sulfatase BDS1-like metallo-beta-lactamase superfamily hydrolase